jgi:hypothetical protein
MILPRDKSAARQGGGARSAQQKVWAVIRGLREFGFEEVSMLADLPYKAVSSYLKSLYLAGYIRQVGKRKEADGRRKNIWRLARNSGPRAPIPCKCLYDPNIDDLAEVKDVA